MLMVGNNSSENASYQAQKLDPHREKEEKRSLWPQGHAIHQSGALSQTGKTLSFYTIVQPSDEY